MQIPNYFQLIADRLSNIEALLIDIKHPNPADATSQPDPYGDFNWLSTVCHGVPTSTLRIKSAAGEIPGVVKFGKRVLYEKVIVLDWLRSQTRKTTSHVEIEQTAEEQINQQLAKKDRQKSTRG